MEFVVVDVTREHIDAGERGSCVLSPVAIAMRAAGLPCRLVGVTHARMEDGSEAELPPHVVRFVEDYDAGYAVYPIVFGLEVAGGDDA
jgi:hypothetical protein